MEDLNKMIEDCRKRMYDLSLNNSLTSMEIIDVSCELDNLLNKLDEYKTATH